MLCSGLRAWSFVSSLSILTECRTAVQRSQKFDTSQLCQNNYSLDAGLPIHGHVRRHVEHLRGEALCREGRELVLEVAGVGLQRELVQGHLFGLLADRRYNYSCGSVRQPVYTKRAAAKAQAPSRFL